MKNDIYNVKICPSCDYDDVKVVDTKYLGGFLKRRRKCPKCGYTYHTIEVFVGQDTGKALRALKEAGVL